MAELNLQHGDYVPDGVGGLRRAEGREALLQRVIYKLTARRGQFPFREDLGSRLWKLGRTPAGERRGAAEQAVAEALADEEGLRVESVTLAAGTDHSTALTAALVYQGERLSVTLDIQ